MTTTLNDPRTGLSLQIERAFVSLYRIHDVSGFLDSEMNDLIIERIGIARGHRLILAQSGETHPLTGRAPRLVFLDPDQQQLRDAAVAVTGTHWGNYVDLAHASDWIEGRLAMGRQRDGTRFSVAWVWEDGDRWVTIAQERDER